MRKILYIANYKEGVGGISGQVEMLHKCVNSNQYEADIFSTRGNIAARLWKFIELICVAKKYDVLHIHGCSDRGMLPVVYGVVAGKIWRKKIIITYHGGGAEEYFAKHGAFVRRWLCRADKVIVLNGYLEKVFGAYNIPCVVIPNIIELSEAQEHSAYQWSKPRLISVRHLRELYNIPSILKAFAIVQEQVPGATLTVLGDGPMRHELEQMAIDLMENKNTKNTLREINIENISKPKMNHPQSLDNDSQATAPYSTQEQALGQTKDPSIVANALPDDSEKNDSILESQKNTKNEAARSIQFIGQVKSSEMAGYLAKSDIMLSAPRIDNMPVSLMEAMNAGVLVISSNVGGVPYLVEDQKSGLLFESQESRAESREQALAEKILWAVKNSKECEQMIANAKLDIAKYNWKEIKKQILPIYE